MQLLQAFKPVCNKYLDGVDKIRVMLRSIDGEMDNRLLWIRRMPGGNGPGYCIGTTGQSETYATVDVFTLHTEFTPDTINTAMVEIILQHLVDGRTEVWQAFNS